MSKLSILPIALCLAASPALRAAEHRELGAHEHGHGTLNIAVEGNAVRMELEAPGDDIVGFEHDPSTPAETKTIAAAKATLAKPLELFQPPAAAKCMVKDTKVTIREEEHEGDHAEGQKDKEKAEAHHNEFYVEYALECAAIEEMKSLRFGYFAAFPKAQSLTVNVIMPKGQSRFEASRTSSKIDLGGSM